MSKTEKNTEKTLSSKDMDYLKTASIMIAVNMETAFKLYSYRCIDELQYQSRIEELIAQYQQERKKVI